MLVTYFLLYSIALILSLFIFSFCYWLLIFVFTSVMTLMARNSLLCAIKKLFTHTHSSILRHCSDVNSLLIFNPIIIVTISQLFAQIYYICLNTTGTIRLIARTAMSKLSTTVHIGSHLFNNLTLMKLFVVQIVIISVINIIVIILIDIIFTILEDDVVVVNNFRIWWQLHDVVVGGISGRWSMKWRPVRRSELPTDADWRTSVLADVKNSLGHPSSMRNLRVQWVACGSCFVRRKLNAFHRHCSIV